MKKLIIILSAISLCGATFATSMLNISTAIDIQNKTSYTIDNIQYSIFGTTSNADTKGSIIKPGETKMISDVSFSKPSSTDIPLTIKGDLGTNIGNNNIVTAESFVSNINFISHSSLDPSETLPLLDLANSSGSIEDHSISFIFSSTLPTLSGITGINTGLNTFTMEIKQYNGPPTSLFTIL